jgi:hypothetical protein
VLRRLLLTDVPLPLVLAILVTTSAAWRSASTWSLSPGWIVPDESVYFGLSQGVAHHASLTFLGHSVGFYSFWYPVFLAPFALVADPAVSAHVIGICQAVVMSLTAIPVFLWGRRFMRGPYALLAAGLSLCLPHLAYSRLMLTETVYSPLLVTALWLTAETVLRPTLRRQSLLLVVCTIVVTSRLQGLILLAVIPSAIALFSVLERRRPERRDYAVLIGAAATIAGIALAALSMGHGEQLVGSYSSILGRYDVRSAIRYTLSDSGGLTIIVGFIPALAFLALAIQPRVVFRESREAAAFMCTALAAVFWCILEVGVFSSKFAPGRMMGRYLFALAPLLFLALAYWLNRPKSRLVLTILSAVLVVNLAGIPRTLVERTGAYDAPSLVTWSQVQGFGLPRWSLLGLAVLAYACAVIMARRQVVLAAIPVALTVLGSAVAVSALQWAADDDFQRTLGSPKQWVDKGDAGRRATIVYTGDMWSESVPRLLFWNPSITSVYVLAAPLNGPVPTSPITVNRAGAVSGLEASTRYVVSSTALTWRGTMLRRTPSSPHLALWRITSPPRLTAWVRGLNEASALYTTAVIRLYSCRQRRVRVSLTALFASDIRITAGAGRSQQLRLAAGSSWRGTISPPQRRRTCSVSITTSNPVKVGVQVVRR